MRAQLNLVRRFQHQRCQVVQLAHGPLQFTEHAGDTGIGIHQVGRGVAFKAEHLIKIEAVIAAAMLGQVGIFHRADTNGGSNLAQFTGR